MGFLCLFLTFIVQGIGSLVLKMLSIEFFYFGFIIVFIFHAQYKIFFDEIVRLNI